MIFNIPITESVNVSSLKIIKDPSSYIIKNRFKVIKNYKLSGKEYIIMAKSNADISQFNKFTFA